MYAPRNPVKFLARVNLYKPDSDVIIITCVCFYTVGYFQAQVSNFFFVLNEN